MSTAKTRSELEIVLPGSSLLTSERTVAWTLRLVWLLLPLDIALAHKLVIGQLNQDNPQFISFSTHLQIISLKLASILAVALLFWFLLKPWLSVWLPHSRATAKASLGHFILWLLAMWLASLIIWVFIEMVHDFVSGFLPDDKAGNSVLETLKSWRGGKLPELSLYGPDPKNGVGYFWGWFVPILFFMILALGVVSGLQKWKAPRVGSHLLSFVTLLVVICAAAAPLAFFNACAYCITDQGNPGKCDMQTQFKAIFVAPFDQKAGGK